MTEQMYGFLNLSVVGPYCPEDSNPGENVVCCTVNIVTYLVTRHGVWIGNWIYWPLINRNYK
jgi:hypothetical protein